MANTAHSAAAGASGHMTRTATRTAAARGGLRGIFYVVILKLSLNKIIFLYDIMLRNRNTECKL